MLKRFKRFILTSFGPKLGYKDDSSNIYIFVIHIFKLTERNIHIHRSIFKSRKVMIMIIKIITTFTITVKFSQKNNKKMFKKIAFSELVQDNTNKICMFEHFLLAYIIKKLSHFVRVWGSVEISFKIFCTVLSKERTVEVNSQIHNQSY